MTNKLKADIKDFIKILLTGYGQTFFCCSPVSGFFILFATFLCPYAALLGLAGALASMIQSYRLGLDIAYIKSGIFACNGALIGIALGIFLDSNFSVLLILIPGCFVSNYIIKLLVSTIGRKYDMPALSVAFVSVSWIAIIIGRTLLPQDSPPFSISAHYLHNFFPQPPFDVIFEIFKMIGATVFQVNSLTGIICLIGIMFYSRILFLFAVFGSVLTYLVLIMLGISSEFYLCYAFNSILIFMALGIVFIRYSKYSLIYACICSVTGIFFSLVLWPTLRIIGLPALAAPVNFILLLALYVIKVFFPWNEKIIPVPLYDIRNPDEYFIKKDKKVYKQKTMLTMPFMGIWYVSQGNGGKITHFDKGHYAWDFVVTDDDRQSFRNLGIDIKDYFAWGLPVISPAPGTIIRVEKNFKDNRPKRASKESISGNFVIIDHGNNEYSEISHFKYQSILVNVGDYVERGQLLGYCGNSGKSLEPHIHIQLQEADYLGANTLPSVFSNYFRILSEGEEQVESGIPVENERIRGSEE